MVKSIICIGFFVGFIAVLHDSCASDRSSELYYHQKGIIVLMGNDTETVGLPARKHTIGSRTALIRLVEDTTVYLELTSEIRPFITPEWWYNHKVGDTVRFDYIRQDRCFHIKDIESIKN